jgi:hypothetical protein
MVYIDITGEMVIDNTPKAPVVILELEKELSDIIHGMHD